MNLAELSSVLAAEPKFRYAQINKALFQDYISAWDEASNLPKNLRDKLTAACPLEIEAQVFKTAGDSRSIKALITLADGEAIETVLIRQHGSQSKASPDVSGRNTVCVSSQVGCPLGCAFCATGAAGFRRNLTAEEIVEQVIFWARFLKTDKRAEKIDNVVFMGMGEPFLNYAEFIKAVKFLNNPETLNIGARRLSVSTVGLTEGIKRLSGEKIQMNLAISLHAPNDALRRDLIPVAQKYPLREIFRAVDDYIRKTGRRVMFEYLMIKGVNDRDQEAEELAELMKKPLYLVNLIPYNATGKFRPSDRARIDAFKKILDKQGVPATVRLSFGAAIGAACGQLRGKLKKLNPSG
ncbi:TPA: 23S rRNA (adenine(2503)-C(2))-methyltransferase RlmN [Candidatus Falkowbacteria bacterium]|nr:23S rRNA (adenine(2503)-C(2))-methyltransferase RlmN [Candidatus Falkowbacteria bacterium]